MISAHFFDSTSSPAEHAALSSWAHREIYGAPGGFGPGWVMAAIDREILAVVAYHNWQPEAGVIEITCASSSPRWLNARIARNVLALPFEHIGCQLVVTRISERNEPALRLNRKLGFEFTRIPRLRGRDEAEMIGQLTDDAWRGGAIYKRGNTQ